MFERSLGEELSHRLGVQVSIWRDLKKLRVGRDWHSDIEEAVRKSAVFIAVLSPSYRNSEWCKKERDTFRRLFREGEFEKSHRFYKVVKTPWENDGHRAFWPTLKEAELFRREDGPVGAVEFLPGSREFQDAIAGLANSLVERLRRLRRERERIFVASPAEDCYSTWKRLCGELSARGYDVQPEGPRDDGFGDELILPEVENALLSVHLLGSVYDPFAQRQIRLAADLGRKLVFWLNSELEGPPEENQVRLIETVRNGKRPDRPAAELPRGWALLENLTSQRLIDEVAAFLKPKGEATVQPLLDGGAPRVYIVHDATTEEDAQIAMTLQKEIHAREGMEVFLSRADLPSATELQLRHQSLLQTCEGVLLCRKAAPKEWWTQVALEVLHLEKLHHRAPPKSRAFLMPDPAPPWSEWPNLKVIPYSPELRPSDLEPFLAPLRTDGSIPHGH